MVAALLRSSTFIFLAFALNGLSQDNLVNAFFHNNVQSRTFSNIIMKEKSSSLTEEAIAVYDKKYPFDRDPPNSALSDILSNGMPDRDLDGSQLKRRKESSTKRFSDITKDQAKATFLELCKVYEDDRALEMVKRQPLCLAFDRTVFLESFRVWESKYGTEETKEMVKRNPGLLSITPEEAAKGNDQTMIFSYILEFTRPIGPLILGTMSFLLISPAIEAITGIPVRTTFLKILKSGF